MIVELDDYRPHVVVDCQPRLGEKVVYCVPLAMLRDVVEGKLALAEVEDGELLFRAILGAWLDGEGLAPGES